MVLSHLDVDVIERLDVHLNRVHNVEVNRRFSDVASRVRNSALSRQNLGLVVVFDVGERLTVVLQAAAAQVMQVVDQPEDATVHNHELDLCHLPTRKAPQELTRVHDAHVRLDEDVRLMVVHRVMMRRILELELILILHQQVRQSQEVDQQRGYDDQWSKEDREECFTRAMEVCDYLIDIGCGACVDDFKRSQKLAEEKKEVFFTAGVHPHDADTAGKSGAELRQMRP